MRQNYRQRNTRFEVMDDCLVRTVVDAAKPGAHPGAEKSYQHRCPKQAFQTVAHAIGEAPAQGAGTTPADIAKQENLPFTQVDVAMDFLKERGIVVIRGRRCYPAAITTYEDAMTEYCYLAEAPY